MTSPTTFAEKVAAPFQPVEGYRYDTDNYRLDRERLAFFVGLVAILLPVLILVSNLVGYTVARNTISHYYYAIFLGDILIIMIAFIGTFLFAYKGESRFETHTASFAGLAAYGIALFPARGTGIETNTGFGRVFANFTEHGTSKFCSKVEDKETNDIIEYCRLTEAAPAEPPVAVFSWAGSTFDLFTWSSAAHAISTGVLFLFLAFYSYFVFTRVKDIHRNKDRSLKEPKALRNKIYKATGIIILVCILAIFLEFLYSKYVDENFAAVWRSYDATFILESIAMVTFGFAWLVKGKFLGVRLFGWQWAD